MFYDFVQRYHSESNTIVTAKPTTMERVATASKIWVSNQANSGKGHFGEYITVSIASFSK